ncbi:hypothetical protein P152DRAFT_476875 [Eremomyces bilateralis CBS 781.70]|uniref:DNA-directed RNA polymerase subunit n=1 Tax=Eremomyces bilateralis CBS 781.70 TaxID=1392243 RepID=A0A6G1FT98_9PEZI|nr:uncharacterized protein P152DRAFT_476875 [Eremomyces bilateralis CBS 781.70]KAF1808938.1 hypothetical protein P152DRAFT_476875 [Eremomyces bilateralis CBS 781.70]
MFILTTFDDLIQIPPQEFDIPSHQVIEDKINGRYADRVIQKVGLCICLYDVLEVSDGLIGHGTGMVNVNVTFRMVVFRPFQGEILEGTLWNSDAEGIKLHTNFFSDIYVPKDALFDNTNYNSKERVHVWDTNPDAANQHPGAADDDSRYLWFDLGETVRFRIEGEVWMEEESTTPKPPIIDAPPPGKQPDPHRVKAEAGDVGQEKGKSKVPPYRIMASMSREGLGPTMWWTGGEDEGMDEEYQEEGEATEGGAAV